ncbi:hypothetical protein [Pseudorhodoferax soli]|uniref:Uncharacterized protein n=1 Tax=Pseudorhodoferax soli TaxID=545864 RepID=A0A368Y6N5_9BURK|nr:hypothetical protein [Pseudorhodoferax soli]RCW75755.1 hypothetical protein DES41_101350 [Pseudorhodoferax soli]
MHTDLVFALLAVAFLVAAAVRALRLRRADGAVRTWAWLALVFGAVATWLAMTFGH